MKQYDRMISGLLYSWKIKDEHREELSKKRGEFLDKFNSTSYMLEKIHVLISPFIVIMVVI